MQCGLHRTTSLIASARFDNHERQMTHDFDQVIPLRNTHSSKHDNTAARDCHADDGLAMWVADMDFRPPQAVIDVLRAEVDRGVFGYFAGDDTTRGAICGWLEAMHGWKIDPAWINFSHGVGHGLSLTLHAFTDPGDGVIMFTPFYHSFLKRVPAMGRRVVESQLRLENGRYELDLGALEASLAGHEKAVILCSPHNPGGRMWSAAEIAAVADFCLKHDLILISDEIHMDLTFPGQTHLPTAVAAPQALPRLVYLSSASKGFNIAGAETSFIVTPDPAIRDRLASARAAYGGTPNRFGMLMTEACFAQGHGWNAGMRAYLRDNFHVLRDGLNAIPGVRVMDMAATYLAWVDFENTGMPRQDFTRRVARDARIAVESGPTFGTGGESFLRFNFAAPRSVISEAVVRMQAAFSDLQ